MIKFYSLSILSSDFSWLIGNRHLYVIVDRYYGIIAQWQYFDDNIEGFIDCLSIVGLINVLIKHKLNRLGSYGKAELMPID